MFKMEKNELIRNIIFITKLDDKEIIEKALTYLHPIKLPKESSNLIINSGLPAIKFKKKDKTIIGGSKKFVNVFFNFRKFMFPLVGNTASVVSLLMNGEIVLSTLAALGLWGVLEDAMDIELNETHSKLLIAIAFHKKNGVTITEEHIESFKLVLGLSDSQFNKVVADLEKMKILKIIYKPSFNVKLLEKIVIKDDIKSITD